MSISALKLLTGLGAVLCAAALWLTVPALAAAATSGAADAVQCTAVNSCTAVGGFTEANGSQQGLLLSEVKGVWQADQLATLPSGAAANPQVDLSDLWCSAGPDCVAVGNYTDGAGNQQALVLTETNGAWSAAKKVALPSGALGGGSQLAELNALWCASAGNCVAAGDYSDSQGNQQGLTVSETNGVWGPGTSTPVPGNAATDPQVALTALDCTAVTSCDVVGIYDDQEGNQEAEILVGAAPSWGNGEMNLPTNAALAAQQVQVNALACGSSSDCVGAGAYINDSGDEEPLILLANGDSFSTLEANLPANADASSNPDAQLTSVWCSSAGNCAVVGDYDDANSNEQGMMLDETDNSFDTARELSLPSDADQSYSGANPQVTLNALWCSSAGNCTAGGGYTNTTQAEVPLVTSEVNGSWQPGLALSLPRGAAGEGNQSASVSAIDCVGASCGAVGSFTSAAGNAEPLLFSSSAKGFAAGVSSAAPPTAAAVKTALATLTAAAKTTLAKIAQSGDTYRFVAAEPGKLTLKWYRLGQLVASTPTVAIPKPETLTVKLTLTAAGKRMLARTRAGVDWDVESVAQFTPSAAYGSTAIQATRSFKLG